MASPSQLTERKGGYFHSLSKVITNETQYPFESKYKSSHNIKQDEIWADIITYCPDSTSADLFVSENPTIIKKYELKTLTEIPGSNGQAWYINDIKFVKPFISPVDVVQDSTNLPSIGFEARLYKNDGTFISPSNGVWYIDYYAGIVHFESGYTPNDLNYGIPKITVYVYIGKTLSDVLEIIKTGSTTTKLITSSKLLISNNEITLNQICLGDVIFNTARVYDLEDSSFYTEYTCAISPDGSKVIFDTIDNLNSKYAVVSYLTTI